MHPAKIWLIAARPRTLAAGLTPVLIGTALAIAADGFHLIAAVCAALGALMIQIGTNFANDYFDFVKGADTADRVGPTRATQAGLVPPRAMLVAALVLFALAFVPGAYLVFRGGWPILALGIASVLCGMLYTGGPYPLGYLGLGDIFVLFFFGPAAVAGTYYVQTLQFDTLAVVAGLMPGLFSMAILTVNNLRDAETDARSGKRTLAVRFGRTFARWEYLLSIVIGGLAVPYYLCVIATDNWGGLAGCLAVILAARLVRNVFFSEDAAVLNATLAGTGKVLLFFSILFSIGWVL